MNSMPSTMLLQVDAAARAFDLARCPHRQDRDRRGNEEQRAREIGRGQAAVIDQKAADGGADEKTGLQDHGIDDHGVHQQTAAAPGAESARRAPAN